MTPSAYLIKVGQEKDGFVYIASPHDPVSMLGEKPENVVPTYAIDFTKYVVVPIEPTEEMLIWTNGLSKLRYKAMIEAAPKIEELE
jgi:hypothetical protein